MSITGPPETPVQDRRRDRRRGHRPLRDGRRARRALRAPRRPAAASASTIDLLSANLAMLANQSTGWLADGQVPLRLGNDHPSIEPFATYAAADGDLMVGAGNDGQFAASPRRSAPPSSRVDPRFATNEARVAQPRRAPAAARGAPAARARARVARPAARGRRSVGAGADDRRGVLARGRARARRDRRDRRRAHRGVSRRGSPRRRRPCAAARPDLDEHGGDVRRELGG